jgi:hypothetical protein
MKNAFGLILVAFSVICFASCKKCYHCHNECKVCRKQRPDTTLTIQVCSDKLGDQYYVAYIDSLTSPSLGWVCGDTASNYAERFCESQSQADLLNKKAAGLICAPE